MYNPPDRPLIIKCTFDKWHKRINFTSARNCSYDILRSKIEQCFSLFNASYAIAYKDDDGEVSTILTDNDLLEAIQYFQAGDDAPISSAASILSGRSFGARKITLRVSITVDYDGPSLSDTSSLASLEEFKDRNGSRQSFSFGAPTIDLDDDSVTVSSRDPGTSSARNGRSFGSSLKSIAKQRSFVGSGNKSKLGSEQMKNGQTQQDTSLHNFQLQGESSTAFYDNESISQRFPADPSAVFERLKLSEAMGDDASTVDFDSLAASERGAAWLRDQSERVIRSKIAVPAPSVSDGMSLSLDSRDDSLGGDLALERDQRGKYYYTYTAGSTSHVQGSVDEEGQGSSAENDYTQSIRGPRPTSMQLNWLASQQRSDPNEAQRRAFDLQSISIQEDINEHNAHLIDKELLPFLPAAAGPSQEILTDCSNCGLILNAIRYVCSTCGEKAPLQSLTSEKGKERDSSPINAFTYPPSSQLFSNSNSSSSQTYLASPDIDSQRYKPLPSVPSDRSLSSLPSIFGTSRTHLNVPTSPSSSQASHGYELCSACLELVGINHAIEAGFSTPGSSPIISNMSPSYDDPQRASQWRRAAPKKGQVRHAYREKAWGHFGWEDVAYDEAQISQCSMCSVVTENKRYKCVSCNKLHLCRACYRQVHELHPSHPFLIVPDKPGEEVVNELNFSPHMLANQHEELSLTHPGVKCAHCLLDIVGARFHCAICDSVDICSNCESAGLPGNLDSADGGHTSSHILIKIPYPLENNELRNASRRAKDLWTGRDAANVGFALPRSKTESEISSYARTMIGSREAPVMNDHRIFCNGCGDQIIGIRYQCAHCPSKPLAFNLCSVCEARSYVLHDPMHIFFKLRKPVNRPLESNFPLLPPLYKTPAGPAPNAPRSNDPRAFLASLIHNSAICDRCMDRITGEWFRCAYCNCDLCDVCESDDTHDATHRHVFLVFKSSVDMHLFKSFAKLDEPGNGHPIIPYPVYI